MTTQLSPEKQLARAYDDLVDSGGKGLSFQEQAALVAVFVRRYVQNLFLLSDGGFRSVMKKHCELHARAEQAERQGKSPLVVLQRRMEKQDDLGRILKRYAEHLGSLDCILDIRATAALVHHLTHLQPPDQFPDRVTGCEFGSGTGVLAAAGTIPLIRGGRVVTMHSFEQSQVPREDALRLAEILQKESRYGSRLQFHLHHGDITAEQPYQLVCGAAGTSGPLALWISETFGYRSKKIVIVEGSCRCSYEEPAGIPSYSADEEKLYDPLPLVLDLSCRHFDGFLQKVRAGEILAFPDIATPRVIVDGERSAILSPDGQWRKLSMIGSPYQMLPPCVPSRWYLAEKTQGVGEIKTARQNRSKKARRKYFSR